jgi:hypothetical protein
MSRYKNNSKSAILSLFNRRDKKSLPENEATVDIAGTLEEISRQVHKEATENRSMLEEDFFSPTHVLKQEIQPKETAPAKRERALKRCRLRPEQYENIIENSLSVLDMAGQIIDRNRAITSRLKRAPVE